MYALRLRTVRALAGQVTLLLIVSSGVARGQAVGVRAGVSGDPDQFYVGAHYETTPFADHLTFRPNLEVGVGSDVTLVAGNLEFAYHIPLKHQPWTLYAGGGPAFNIFHVAGDTSTEGGFNILVGVEHQQGVFFELKFGAFDSPTVKLGVGYSFR